MNESCARQVHGATDWNGKPRLQTLVLDLLEALQAEESILDKGKAIKEFVAAYSKWWGRLNGSPNPLKIVSTQSTLHPGLRGTTFSLPVLRQWLAHYEAWQAEAVA